MDRFAVVIAAPFPGYFLFGRWVSADAAALLAALLLFGSRKSFAAALAAFLLVTSRFVRRFGILPLLPNLLIAAIDDRSRWE